jgi:hypothetical protein
MVSLSNLEVVRTDRRAALHVLFLDKLGMKKFTIKRSTSRVDGMMRLDQPRRTVSMPSASAACSKPTSVAIDTQS